jgi:threonine dehydrogenase-like Zn-dependent dehydrogenase
MGAGSVMISDVNPKRLEIAKSLGLLTLDAAQGVEAFVKETTGGEGVDILYECSGAEPASVQMTDLVRVGGSICMVAVHKVPHQVNLQAFGLKEQTMMGTRVYNREEFRQAVEFAAVIQPELENIVSHVLPLNDCAGVFDLIADEESGAVKVLIDCR